MGLFDVTLDKIVSNKTNIENGRLNSIPFPFKRFNENIPGIIKGTNVIVTAGLS